MISFLCQELSHHAGIVMGKVKLKMVAVVRHLAVVSVFAVHGMIMNVIVGKVDRGII